MIIQEPKEIKLYKDGTELPDSSTLAESKAENGDTIAMAFALPGGTFPSQLGRYAEPDSHVTPMTAPATLRVCSVEG